MRLQQHGFPQPPEEAGSPRICCKYLIYLVGAAVIQNRHRSGQSVGNERAILDLIYLVPRLSISPDIIFASWRTIGSAVIELWSPGTV